MKMYEITESIDPLNELHGAKKHLSKNFSSRQDVVSYMDSKGFTCLGHGTYAAVFDHPDFKNKYVLRLFHDLFYEDFIQFCLARPQNPHLPKFHGKLIKMGNASMIRTERLDSMFDSAAAGPVDDAIERMEPYMEKASKGDEAAHQSLLRIASEIGFEDILSTMLECYKAMPSRAHFDVSSDNIMLRSSTLVINDPWWGAKKPFMR